MWGDEPRQFLHWTLHLVQYVQARGHEERDPKREDAIHQEFEHFSSSVNGTGFCITSVKNKLWSIMIEVAFEARSKRL